MSPLVTMIVRSMDRPELAGTLASIARQDYPAVETIVVDATGGRHRALPTAQQRPGHTIRVVDAGKPLQRAQAAALGLESARGEWFTFLDDDDTCEPSHISALISAAKSFPSALVVYGKGRLLRADGSIDRLFGRPFNRALMHFGPLFYWQAALIRTQVRELGCTFDPELEVCEDRDFLSQVAEHGEFIFVPELATFNFRPDLGTSGTGSGANRNYARIARFDNLMRAKWAGHGVYHNERAAVLCRQGVRAFFAAELDESERSFAAALALYPGDPNALHGMARVALARGDRALAERHARAAIEINPTAAEYRETLAAILGPAVSNSAPVPQSVGRTAPCPCGSGRRYKECCGRLVAIASTASRDASHATLCASARFALDRGDARSAWEHLKAAAEIRCDAGVGYMLEACCARLAKSRSVASLWTMARRLRTQSSGTPSLRHPPRVTIVAGRDGASGAQQAALLSAVLRAAAEVNVVTEIGTTASSEPASECVVFVDPDAIPDSGGRAIAAQRIVIRMMRNDPAALIRGFARLAGAGSRGGGCGFTLPHAGIVDAQHDDAPIEYPWIDDSLFRVNPPDGESQRALVVGRHGPADHGEDHPDDFGFYLLLAQSGHRVVVPATESLRKALSTRPTDARASGVELSATGPAVTEIDVFLYRGDPNQSGHADPRVLQAMAAARVPVLFSASLGASEWIVDGENGFVAGTEDDALRIVLQLSRDRMLLRRVGLAARASAMATMRAQRSRALAFYLGVNLNE